MAEIKKSKTSVELLQYKQTFGNPSSFKESYGTMDDSSNLEIISNESEWAQSIDKSTEQINNSNMNSSEANPVSNTVGKGAANMDLNHKDIEEVNPAVSDSNLSENDCPDGGWGWLVVCAAFILAFLAGIPNTCFGILFQQFLMDLGTSDTLTAWIFNLAMVNAGFFSYLVGPLVDEYGWRSVALVDSLIFAVGLILCSFATSAWFLFISFSCILGPTIDIAFMVGYIVTPHYFTHRRNLATTIMTCGASLGQMVIPPLITYLQEQYSVQGAMLITGALALNGCVAAMVLHPVEWHKKQFNTNITRTKRQEPTVSNNSFNPSKIVTKVIKRVMENIQYFKSPSALLTSIIIAVIYAASYNFFALIPFAMHQSGYSQEDSSLCLTVSGVLNLSSRVLSAALHCCPGVRVKPIFLTGAFLIATAIIGFSLSDVLVVKLFAMGVCGVGYGLIASLYVLYIVEEFGLPLLNPVISLMGFMMGVFFLTIGPLVGVLHAVSRSYTVSLCFSGGCVLFTVVIGICMPLVRDYEQRRDNLITRL